MSVPCRARLSGHKWQHISVRDTGCSHGQMAPPPTPGAEQRAWVTCTTPGVRVPLWLCETPPAAKGADLLPRKFPQHLWPQAGAPLPRLPVLLCDPVGKGLPLTCLPRRSPLCPYLSLFPLCPYPIPVPFPHPQHPSLSPHMPSPGHQPPSSSQTAHSLFPLHSPTCPSVPMGPFLLLARPRAPPLWRKYEMGSRGPLSPRRPAQDPQQLPKARPNLTVPEHPANGNPYCT